MNNRQYINLRLWRDAIDNQIGQTRHLKLTRARDFAFMAEFGKLAEHQNGLADARDNAFGGAFIVCRDPVFDGAEIILRLRREVNLQGRDRARLCLRGLTTHGHLPVQAHV